MSTSAVLLSGGPDSAVLFRDLCARGEQPLALHLELGERESSAGARCAAAQAAVVGADLHSIDLSESLRTIYRKPLPAVLRGPAVCRSIEPFGSGVALSIAASVAAARGADTLYYGVHKDDTVHRDNCEEFFAALSRAISIDLGREFTIATPLLGLGKGEVVARGAALGVDFRDTWSCTERSTTHCGDCLACGTRRKAFTDAGITDPTTDQHLDQGLAQPVG